MRIGILGTGNVGGTLGRRFCAAGHHVLYGSRDPRGDKVTSLLDGHPGEVEAVDRVELANETDLIVLAVPYGSLEDSVRGLGLVRDKILVDATNPVVPEPLGLALGLDDSAGERVARLARHARVVKAFNTVGWEVMGDPVFDRGRAFLPVAADDAEARRLVLGLAEEIGFDAVDFGPLRNARWMEPLALVWIQMARLGDQGPQMALVRAVRDATPGD